MSHNGDEWIAGSARSMLDALSGLSVWGGPDWGMIQAGSGEALDVIGQAAVFVVLLSDAYVTSSGHRKEVAKALASGRLIIPVLTSGWKGPENAAEWASYAEGLEQEDRCVCVRACA